MHLDIILTYSIYGVCTHYCAIRFIISTLMEGGHPAISQYWSQFCPYVWKCLPYTGLSTGLMSQLTSAYLPATLLALHLASLRYEVFPGGEEYSRKALSLWPYNCFGGQPSTPSLSHCWQTGTSTWQSCWVGLRPSGINLLRYPCAIHLRFDNGHEEQLIYAVMFLWKAWDQKRQASRGWTWRTLFTLSCLLGLRPILWCKLFFSYKL